VRIKLQGGDILDLETNDFSAKSKAQTDKETEAIIFLPETTVSSAVYPGSKLPQTVTGPRSNYGRVITYGNLALSDWAVHSRVLFHAHQAPSVPFTHGSKPSAPLVLRLAQPFRFAITGSHGEILFRGKVVNPTKNHEQ
jgi:hypothetical protein